MKLTFETVHVKGLEVGWSGLSFQEHAVLLFHKVNESVLEKELKRLIRKCEHGTKKLRKELKQYPTKKDTSNG